MRRRRSAPERAAVKTALLSRELLTATVGASMGLRQAAAGFGFFHAARIVHCDCKPENLCVGKGSAGGYTLKICDFGGVCEVGSVGAPGAGTAPYRPAA